MAKRKYRTQEAIDIIKQKGIRNMSVKELKEVGTSLMSTVKSRLRRLEEENLVDSPAYIGYVKDLKMKASVKSKNVNVLRHEVFEAYKFLTQAKTSTVKGAKEFYKRMEDIIGLDYKKMRRDEREGLFYAYHKIENEHPYIFQKYSYDVVMTAASVAHIDEIPIEDRLGKIIEWLDPEYYQQFVNQNVENVDITKNQEEEEEETPWTHQLGGNRW